MHFDIEMIVVIAVFVIVSSRTHICATQLSEIAASFDRNIRGRMSLLCNCVETMLRMQNTDNFSGLHTSTRHTNGLKI